jgi:hypothetical protein
MRSKEELRKIYDAEHAGNPHVEHELAFVNWVPLYLKFEAIEGKLKAEPGHPNYDELDRESSRLCRILGY